MTTTKLTMRDILKKLPHPDKFSEYPCIECLTPNNKNSPKDVSISNNKLRFEFECDECQHVFTKTPKALSSDKSWCPYCCNASKLLCKNDKCMKCFNRSMVSHEKIIYLSPNNKTDPRTVFKGNKKKKDKDGNDTSKLFIFKCNVCFHEFSKSAHDMTTDKTWCPYCSDPPKLLCDDDKCDRCFNKSFASHANAKHWSDKNIDETTKIFIKPRQVFKSSHSCYYFKCDKCNREFRSRLDNVSCNQQWCRFCANQTEGILYDFLSLKFSVDYEVKYDWCKSSKRFHSFDFVIEDLNIIVELDGDQHFRQIRGWESQKKIFETDKFKEKCANDNKYSTIRLMQNDVYNNKYDWKKELLKNINILIKKKRGINIYMCKNDEYKHYN
jgi:very-short-patch-repair endonuclease